MAFCFRWPEFDAEVIERARNQLEIALNRGVKPTNICDIIKVSSLHMGTTPPTLDILEIGELSEERFRGIFKLTYGGDAHVLLHTKVQANPLTGNTSSSSLDLIAGPGVVVAEAPLIVPLELKISQFQLRGIFVLIVSLTRGVTLSFKNDPLESVLVTSTFDNVPSIRRHLQREIEQRLGALFREDLPLLVHNLSLEAIRSVADKIPLPFRAPPAPPPGYFRYRRSLSLGAHASSNAPSRVSSPVSSIRPESGGSFDEVYYFKRNSIIHRTVSRLSVCDPLVGPTIDDLNQRRSSLITDLSSLLECLPLVGEEAKEYIDRRFSHLGEKAILDESRTSPCGLGDPVIFLPTDKVLDGTRSGIGGSETLVINSGGTPQLLELPQEALGTLLNGSKTDYTQRQPSVYKAPRQDAANQSGEGFGEETLLDPDEFRSMDSLPMANLQRILTTTTRTISFGPVILSRSVERSSLSTRLGILRAVHENPSPFVFPSEDHIIHRSQVIPRSKLSCPTPPSI